MWDLQHRFLIESRGVRGSLVRLDHAARRNVSAHAYPAPVAELVGEAVTAAALLISSLKIHGRLSLQLQGSARLPLLVAECTHDGGVRAVARWDAVPADASFADLVRGGTLVMNLIPDEGQPYQGVVPLDFVERDGATLADCLMDYFRLSEQLATDIRLFFDDGRGVGLLLQALPGEECTPDDFEHVVTLAATVQAEEAWSLPVETLLHRLYHEEDVRLFDPTALRFQCRCSRERCADSLRLLSTEERQQALAEQGQLTVTCDFCNEHYRFDAVDVAALDHPASATESSVRAH